MEMHLRNVPHFLNDPDRYKAEDLTVAVVGSGNVGLPYACVCSMKNVKRIWLIDKSPPIVARLREGYVPFYEPDLQEIYSEYFKKNIFVADDVAAVIAQSDVILVTVSTPINAFNEPNITNVVDACSMVAQATQPGVLILIMSTVPVGTTRSLIAPLFTKSELRIDEDIGIVFSPERMVEGMAIKTIQNFPKLISALGDKSQKAAVRFFDLLGIKTEVLSNPEEAEMAKLLCNIYRMVNIALANELAILCEKYGLNATRVFKAANTSPLVNIMRPGMMGGSCLTKDPYFVLDMSSKVNFNLKIVEAAKKVVGELPNHVAQLFIKAMLESGKDLRKSKLAILGIAYKGDTSDMRETPIIPLANLLCKMGVGEIIIYDPFVNEARIREAGLKAARSIDEAFQDSDCIIIGAEHSVFKDIDYTQFLSKMREKPIIIDGKGFLGYRILDSVVQKGIGCL